MIVSLRKAQVLARALLESPDVVASVKRRLIAGELPEEIEVMLWELAYPPPGLRAEHEPVRRPTLAFATPRISDDERHARTEAAVFDGDVETVAALMRHGGANGND